MTHFPENLDDWLVSAEDRFPGRGDDYHFHYQLKCRCGCDKFELSWSDAPTVTARCVKCSRIAPVYDLRCYTSASPSEEPETFKTVGADDGQGGVRVFIMFEYGKLDEGVVFDRNDITWCQVFLERIDGVLQMVVDDETA